MWALTLAAFLVVCGATEALAATGDWTQTYDFPAGAGSAGWTATDDVLSAPLWPGPYYTTHLNGGPHGPGLGVEPLGGMLYGHNDTSQAGGGPRALLSMRAPGTTTIQSGTFSGIDFLNKSESQVLRVAVYPQLGQGAGAAADLAPPTPNPGVVVSNASRSVIAPGGEADIYAQVWLYTVCKETIVGSGIYDNCPTLPLAPGSYGHVAKVVLAMHDPETPAIAATGPLTTTSGWTNSRQSLPVTLTGTDPGSGAQHLALTVKSPGQSTRTVLSADNPACDPNHNVAGPAGREAQVCPDTQTTNASDQLAKLPDGASVYTATATDLSGRTATSQFTINIDRAPPTGLSATGVPTGLTNGQTPTLISAQAADSRSGVAQITATLAGQPAGSIPTGGVPAAHVALAIDASQAPEGIQPIRLTATDTAGNTSPAKQVGALRIDRTPPLLGPIQAARHGTTTTFTTHATDTRSGVATYQARTRTGNGDFSAWHTASGGRISIDGDNRTIELRATDHANNTSPSRQAHTTNSTAAPSTRPSRPPPRRTSTHRAPRKTKPKARTPPSARRPGRKPVARTPGRARRVRAVIAKQQHPTRGHQRRNRQGRVTLNCDPHKGVHRNANKVCVQGNGQPICATLRQGPGQLATGNLCDGMRIDSYHRDKTRSWVRICTPKNSSGHRSCGWMKINNFASPKHHELKNTSDNPGPEVHVKDFVSLANCRKGYISYKLVHGHNQPTKHICGHDSRTIQFKANAFTQAVDSSCGTAAGLAIQGPRVPLMADDSLAPGVVVRGCVAATDASSQAAGWRFINDSGRFLLGTYRQGGFGFADGTSWIWMPIQAFTVDGSSFPRPSLSFRASIMPYSHLFCDSMPKVWLWADPPQINHNPGRSPAWNVWSCGP